MIINAKVLFTGKEKLENVSIEISGNKIVKINKKLSKKADIEGYVTPAIIDPHSHIGMFREGEPGSEQEGNDYSNQIMPLNNPLNSIYFDDRAFVDAVDFGHLYSCVVPGSGNLIGGKAVIIKNFATNRDDAFVKDYGYKMALGYNPRSTTSWKGERPNTRMGVNRLLESTFDEVLLKEKKAKLEKEEKLVALEKKKAKDDINDIEYKQELDFINRRYENSFSSQDKAVLDILSGKKTVKIHVHKEDDALYLIELVNKYGIKATADHVADVFRTGVFDKLAENNIPVIYGPLGCPAYKVELKNAFYRNTEKLMKSKADYGLMTDHPVISAYNLRDSLKFFMINGMDDNDAISLITYKSACLLGVDDKLGSVEKGKLASLVVWNQHPLYLGSYPDMVIGEGEILRDRR